MKNENKITNKITVTITVYQAIWNQVGILFPKKRSKLIRKFLRNLAEGIDPLKNTDIMNGFIIAFDDIFNSPEISETTKKIIYSNIKKYLSDFLKDIDAIKTKLRDVSK